jgi:hypothetical protein
VRCGSARGDGHRQVPVLFLLSRWGLLSAKRNAARAGKAMFQMLGVFAEFERSIIAERVSAGLARARAEGKRLGRFRYRPGSRLQRPASGFARPRRRTQHHRRNPRRSGRHDRTIFEQNPSPIKNEDPWLHLPRPNLGAEGCCLILAEDPEQLARIRHRLTPRKPRHPKKRPPTKPRGGSQRFSGARGRPSSAQPRSQAQHAIAGRAAGSLN